MDITSTAWISCIRRINFYTSVLFSVNHNIISRPSAIKNGRLTRSRLKNLVTYTRRILIVSERSAQHKFKTRCFDAQSCALFNYMEY